jgi:hypothetical protein
MSASTTLFATLQALVGARCYPDTFMQTSGNLPDWPAIRYQMIGGETHTDICGTGDGSADTLLVQVDVVCSTHAERETLTAQVRAAMDALTNPPTTLQGSPRNSYDAETKTYRAELDFYLHN